MHHPRSRARRRARQRRRRAVDRGVQPEPGESGAAGRQHPAQHAGQGRLLHARAQREPAHDRQVVARAARTRTAGTATTPTATSARTCACRQDVANPNDMINTDDGRYVFGTWSAKAHGTYQAPWDLLVTPALRMQAGQPYAPDDSRCTHQLRRAAHPGRADRLAHAGQHHPARRARGEGVQVRRRPVDLGLRATATTSRTRTPRRTSTGARARRSCCR